MVDLVNLTRCEKLSEKGDKLKNWQWIKKMIKVVAAGIIGCDQFISETSGLWLSRQEDTKSIVKHIKFHQRLNQ